MYFLSQNRMATRNNRKKGGGWIKSTPKKILKAYPGYGYNTNYSPVFPPSNTEIARQNPIRAYPGYGYNTNYSPVFPPSNNQEIATQNPIRAYPGYGYNTNYSPGFPPSNTETWRIPKKEVSPYKSLFNRIASGKTRKNAFGRGPNSQIRSKIRIAHQRKDKT
jgi:hypothetical protein